MKYISCARGRLYRAGGFYESEALLQDLKAAESGHQATRVIDEIFPPFSYTRRPPATLATNNALFAEGLLKYYQDVNLKNNKGAASLLVKIKKPTLYNSVLYTTYPDAMGVIYETHRQNDRPYTKLLSALEVLGNAVDFCSHDEVFFYLGSVGSFGSRFNYGHWLVDNLPRLKAIASLRPICSGKTIVILAPSHSPPINNVCIDSIRRLLLDGDWYTVRFIETACLYRFDSLFYVTPISYHPLLKSPESLGYFSRTTLGLAEGAQRERGTEQIFVTRRNERGRALINVEALRSLVEAYGFTVVDPESLAYAEQVSAFSAAGLVVGTMGAAMVNTIFCAPGTDVVYLTPEGWVEPFYWDMAETLGHNYHACYGPRVDAGAPPHLSAFNLPENFLRSILDKIIPQRPHF